MSAHRWVVVAAVLVAGCGDLSTGTRGVNRSTADVQVLNVASTSIDLLVDQTVPPGNSDISFGSGPPCMTVEAISHGLSVRPAGVRTTTVPLPSFAVDERYIVLVTGSANALSVSSFRNDYAPGGNGGVRLINLSGVDGYDLHVTDASAALGTPGASNVADGAASAYFSVTTGTKRIRITTAGSSVVVLDLGNVTVPVGSRTQVILAPPAGSTLRGFLHQIAASSTGC